MEGEDSNHPTYLCLLFNSKEANLLPVIAAKHGRPLLKPDASIFLRKNGIRQEGIHLLARLVAQPLTVMFFYSLKLVKSMYGTNHAARRWHISLSHLMEQTDNLVLNSSKTIRMKCQGSDFIFTD